VDLTASISCSLVALAETGRRFQISCDELLNSLLGCYFAVDHKRLNSVSVEILGCSPAHAVTENSIAILQCRHNTGMTVRLIAMPRFAITLAFGMGRVRIGTHGGFTDLFAIDIKDDEALGSPKVMRNRYAIYGSYRYLHGTLLIKSLLQS
jgi:hypothetical protein